MGVVQSYGVKTMSKFFDETGQFIGTLPEDCVKQCTCSGDALPDVEYWIKELDFSVPRQQAIDYLVEFGAWPLDTDEWDTGLNDMSDRELAIKVLWIACGDIKENGEWLGLIH